LDARCSETALLRPGMCNAACVALVSDAAKGVGILGEEIISSGHPSGIVPSISRQYILSLSLVSPSPSKNMRWL
jgi:hypothetical protein